MNASKIHNFEVLRFFIKIDWRKKYQVNAVYDAQLIIKAFKGTFSSSVREGESHN